MKKKKNLWIAILVCMTLLFSVLPVDTVEAALGTGWTVGTNGVMLLDGTTVTARLSGNVLYIEGIGEIPDYDPTTYVLRPWHYLEFDSVVISSGITKIGKYAFADKSKLKTIHMPSTTFLADQTCFANIAYNPVFRINGITAATKQYGTVSYSSLESIVAYAPGGLDCCFLMDNAWVAQEFRNLAYPNLKYVYDASDESLPWNKRIDITKEWGYSPVCKIAPGFEMGLFTNISAQKRPQGEAFMEFISYFIEDYTYVCSYNMVLANQKGALYSTQNKTRYVLYLPQKEQIFGRQYRLMQIAPTGQLLYLEDLDSSIETVTFETYYPTATFALTYKYDMNLLMSLTQ